MELQVNLDSFRGPLDLLLFLVKRHEVDIFDIPIGKITDQFVEYLNTLRQVDVELAGDFLVMAATLMEIKSKMLLPAEAEPGVEDAGEDPRLELVKQLVEYRKFKDAAALLESRAEEQGARLPRIMPEEPTRPGGPPPVRPVELWDLVSAFGRLMREAEALQPTPIIVDDTPQHVYAAEVTMQLRREGTCSFHSLFHPPYTRSRLVGLFLALLEMVRRFDLEIEQGERFGEFWVRLREDAPPPEEDAAETPAP
jgi:segregation and condensation protein A